MTEPNESFVCTCGAEYKGQGPGDLQAGRNSYGQFWRKHRFCGPLPIARGINDMPPRIAEKVRETGACVVARYDITTGKRTTMELTLI